MLASYTFDNLLEILFGETFALQLVPEAQFLTEINSGTQPFVHNYFCLSIGLAFTFMVAMGQAKWQWDRSHMYLAAKALSILAFISCSMLFFRGRSDASIWVEPDECYPWAFGYLLGIYAFSFTQPSMVPVLVSEKWDADHHRRPFKAPLALAMTLVSLT